MVSPPFDAAFQFASHVIATTGCPFVNAVAFPIDKQIPMLAPVPIASTNPARIGLAGINMTSYLDQTPALSSLLSFKLGGDLSNSMRGRTGYIFELPKDTEELNPMVSKMAPGSGVKGHMLIVLVDDDGFQVDATHADIRPICIGAARALLTRRADALAMLAFDNLDVPVTFFTNFQHLPEYRFPINFAEAMPTMQCNPVLSSSSCFPMSREPFQVPELIELIASLSNWSRRDVGAFRLSGRVPSIVGRRFLFKSIILHGHFDAIDGHLLLSRIDALTAMVHYTPSLAPLIKRVSLSSWGADGGWLRSDAIKNALSILCEGGGATELCVARLGVEESLGSAVRDLLQIAGSNLIRLKLVHILDAPKDILEGCVNLQDLSVDGLRMVDKGHIPIRSPSLTIFRYSHSSGIGLANGDCSPDPLLHAINWNQLQRLIIRTSWYRDVWALNYVTMMAHMSLHELELEISSFHRHNTRPHLDPIFPKLGELRTVRMVLATHYHFINSSDCPPSAFAFFVALLDCPRLKTVHLECVFGALLRRRYIYNLRWDILDKELVRLGRYGRVRVELDFVYNSSFNVPNWDPIPHEEIPVLVDGNFLMKYFPLSTASDSIDLVLV